MKFFWAALILAFVGCSTAGPLAELRARQDKQIAALKARHEAERAAFKARIETDVADLRQFTIQDAEVTAKYACAEGDQEGCACLPVLAKRIREAHAPRASCSVTREDGSKVAGALCLTETARLAVRPTRPADHALRIACAAYAVQIGEDVGRMIAAGAKAFGSGGATAPGAILGAVTTLVRFVRGLDVGGGP